MGHKKRMRSVEYQLEKIKKEFEEWYKAKYKKEQEVKTDGQNPPNEG